MDKKEYSFEMKIDGREYVVTLHYPESAKKTFQEKISKLLKEDVIKQMRHS